MPLSDQTERDRLAHDFSTSFVVEAGAGTGKTHAVVQRVVAALASGTVRAPQLLAITYTEAAARELYLRIEAGLFAASEGSDAASDFARSALQQLGSASISTIHSFCRQLLAGQAGIDAVALSLRVLDEEGARAQYMGHYRRWLARAGADPIQQVWLAKAMVLGLSESELSKIVHGFAENYDLLEGFSPAEPQLPDLGAAGEKLVSAGLACSEFRLLNRTPDELLSMLERVSSVTSGIDPDDPLSVLAGARLLAGLNPGRKGKKQDWNSVDGSPGVDLVRGAIAELVGIAEELLALCKAELTRWLLGEIALVMKEAAGHRRRMGTASFQDLLIWVRDLLSGSREVLDELRARYRLIVVDEFQDVDPLQAQIVRLLASEGAADLPPGLFSSGVACVVGDSRQSIYRFRRADPSIFLEAAQEAVPAEGRIALVSNFRSAPEILAFVREFFQGTGVDASLTPTHPGGGSVELFGGVVNGGAPEVWTEEARLVARTILAIAGPRGTGEQGGSPAYSYSDVCILVPSRANAMRLEAALAAAGIPVAETTGTFTEVAELRDFLLCLRAVANPFDQVATLGALRGGLFCCSDEELWRWKQSGGSFDLLSMDVSLSTLPDSLPKERGTVHFALATLLAWHRATRRLSGEELALMMAQELNWAQLCAMSPDPAAALSARERVLAAMAGSPRQGAPLPALLEVLEAVAMEGVSSWSVGLSPGVTISTIHHAKGLEYPVVVLTGLGSARATRSRVVIPDRQHGRLEVGTESGFATEGYAIARVTENAEEMAEYERLLYVAMTRAKERLLISVCRGSGQKWQGTAAARVAEVAGRLGLPVPGESSTQFPPASPEAASSPLPPVSPAQHAGPESAKPGPGRDPQLLVQEYANFLAREARERATILQNRNDGAGREAMSAGILNPPQWVAAIVRALCLSSGVAEGRAGLAATAAAREMGLWAQRGALGSIVERALLSGSMRAAAGGDWRFLPAATLSLEPGADTPEVSASAGAVPFQVETKDGPLLVLFLDGVQPQGSVAGDPPDMATAAGMLPGPGDTGASAGSSRVALVRHAAMWARKVVGQLSLEACSLLLVFPDGETIEQHCSGE